MKSKPLIGITVESKHNPEDSRSKGSLSLNWNYTEMVARSGGVPLVIPPTADPEVIAGLIDGWLIPGGLDIDASRFGEVNHPKVELQDPSRFEFESALFDRIPNDLPIFGICYGCQFLNVKLGGTLEQHIPDRTGSEDHSSGDIGRYSVALTSKLGSLVGDSAAGRSYHHQAVSKLGKGLIASAKHEDGTIEALEDPSKAFFLGVQWHPERTPDDDCSQALFCGLIDAAQTYRREKTSRMTEQFVRELVPHLERIGVESAAEIASAIEARYLAAAEGAARLFEATIRLGCKP